MEEKDIDKLFRDAFEHAESHPPSDMWKRIEAELDKKDNVVFLSKKNRFRFLKYTAAAVFLIALGITGYLNQEKESVKLTDNSSPKRIEKTKNASRPETIENEEETQITQTNVLEEQDIKPLKKAFAQKIPKKKAVPVRQLDVQNAGAAEIHKDLYTREEAEEKSFQIATHEVEIPNKDISSQIPVRQVTEVEQLKPLIEPEEEVENMYAAQPTEGNNMIVINILNTISEKIEISTKKDVRFRSDDEGSIRIDFINSLVKNRIKKRK